MRGLPGVAQLLRVDVVESTQTLAKRLAEQGAPDGMLVWAERQTAGRGQFERSWDSATGGLYFSIVWRPEAPPDSLASLSLACAEAVARALRRLAPVETRVKPPNDVYASKDGNTGKICGILIESSATAGRVDWVVAGVGVNVNNDPAVATGVSLRALAGRALAIEDVLRAVLGELQTARNSV